MKSTQKIIQLGLNLQSKEQYTEAIALYRKAVQLNPQDVFTYLNLGHCFLMKQEPEHAFECFFRAIKTSPEKTLDDEKLHYFYSQVKFNRTLEQQLKTELALPIYYRVQADWLDKQGQSEKAYNYYLKLIQLKEPPLLPPILFNTMPKSGSVYISNTLKQTLSLDFFYISNQGFVNDQFYPWSLKRLALGHAISQAHFFAYPENIQQVSQSVSKMITHIRDPRQALLSWVHHLNHLNQKGIAHSAPIDIGKILPPPYFQWDFPEQVNWNIKYYYPLLINFIYGWLTAESDLSNFSVLITSYEEFRLSPQVFFEKILTFLAIDPQLYNFKQLVQPQIGEKNFRKGSIDEWREVFSKKQQNHITQALKKEWINRFNWGQ